MAFSSTAEQDRLYEEAREFAVRRVNPAIGDREGPDYFSAEEWRLCGEIGLLGSCIPERYGGRGHDALTVARVVEGFARGCSDTGLVFAACAHLFACAMPIAEHAGEKLKERVLPRLASGEWVGASAITEPDAGSDVFSLSSTAVRDGDRYVLNGSKSYVTNGPVADCFLVYASTEPTHGYLGITAFLVDGDAPGLRRGDHFDKIGLTGAPVCDVRLEDCPVDESNRIGPEGGGAAIFHSAMEWERACLFAQYLGVMDRQLEEVVAFAKGRRQFGKPVGRHQAIAHRVAEHEVATGRREVAPPSRLLDEVARPRVRGRGLVGQARDKRGSRALWPRRDPDLRRVGDQGRDRRRLRAHRRDPGHHLLGHVGDPTGPHRSRTGAVRLERLVSESAERHPDRAAIKDAHEELSYSQLDALARRTARRLDEVGVRRGDRVAVWLNKSVQAVAVMQGALRLGAAYVPVDPLSPPSRAATIMRDCRIGALVAPADRARSVLTGDLAHVPLVAADPGTNALAPV